MCPEGPALKSKPLLPQKHPAGVPLTPIFAAPRRSSRGRHAKPPRSCLASGFVHRLQRSGDHLTDLVRNHGNRRTVITSGEGGLVGG